MRGQHGNEPSELIRPPAHSSGSPVFAAPGTRSPPSLTIDRIAFSFYGLSRQEGCGPVRDRTPVAGAAHRGRADGGVRGGRRRPSVPYIANLENGRGNPTTAALTRLAEALGLRLVVTLAAEQGAAAGAELRRGRGSRLARPARPDRPVPRGGRGDGAGARGEPGRVLRSAVAALAALAQALGRDLAEADWWRLRVPYGPVATGTSPGLLIGTTRKSVTRLPHGRCRSGAERARRAADGQGRSAPGGRRRAGNGMGGAIRFGDYV